MVAKSISMNIDTGEKTWLTPKWLIDALGDFDLDPCVPDGGMPWKTAAQMVSKSMDGLKADWDGKRIWLNPPYGREAEPFFRKMIHRKSGGGIALVFARTDTRLWQDMIFPNATAILFLRRRLRFCKHDGTPGETATAPSALIAFSEYDAALLTRLSDPMGGNIISGYMTRK